MTTNKFPLKEGYERDVDANYFASAFMHKCKNDVGFALKMLKNGEDLLVAEKLSLDGEVDQYLANHVEFLKDLLSIEGFFKVKFALPDNSPTTEEIDSVIR